MVKEKESQEGSALEKKKVSNLKNTKGRDHFKRQKRGGEQNSIITLTHKKQGIPGRGGGIRLARRRGCNFQLLSKLREGTIRQGKDGSECRGDRKPRISQVREAMSWPKELVENLPRIGDGSQGIQARKKKKDKLLRGRGQDEGRTSL